MSALLLATMLSATAFPAQPVQVEGTARVHGTLVDHESKPLRSAEVRVWTRTSGASVPATWSEARYTGLGSNNAFEFGTIDPGPCVLVAQYESDSAENLIVCRFDASAGERKDLGELRPQGREVSFRMTIRDEAGQDVTAAATTAPVGADRTRSMKFALSNTNADAGPPLAWQFFRPCGTTVFVRGLDAFGSPLELKALPVESQLLPNELRAVSNLNPSIEIGKGMPEHADLDLVVAPARSFVLCFQGPTVASYADAVNWCAWVDHAGNVRTLDTHAITVQPYLVEVWLPSGNFEFHAGGSFPPRSRNDPGTVRARKVVSIPLPDNGSTITMKLESGVSVSGRLIDSTSKDSASNLIVAIDPALVSKGTRRLERGIGDEFIWPGSKDGSFTIEGLLPGGEIYIGPMFSSPEKWKRIRVPVEGGSIGNIVLD